MTTESERPGPSSPTPPYRASLERALADIAARSNTVETPAAPVPHDAGAMRAWIAKIEAHCGQYHTLTPDAAAFAAALEHRQFVAPAGGLAYPIAIPFKGVAPYFVRCLAALAASMDGPATLLLVDTGTDDADASRLATYCRDLGLIPRIARGATINLLNRDYLEFALGVRPRRIIAMNNDMIPAPGFAQRLLDTLDARPEIKMVSAVTNNLQDVYCQRAGLAEGTDEDLLPRVWRFAEERAARRPGAVTPCACACFAAVAMDMDAWASAEGAQGAFKHDFPYDLHVALCLRSAGHHIAVREDSVVYHIGHATYDERGEQADYEGSMRPIVRLVETWGHLPDHYALIAELLYANARFPR